MKRCRPTGWEDMFTVLSDWIENHIPCQGNKSWMNFTLEAPQWLFKVKFSSIDLNDLDFEN